MLGNPARRAAAASFERWYLRALLALARRDGAEATIVCAYTGREQRIAAESLVLVTARQPNDSLFLALSNGFSVGAEEVQTKTLRRIGDCEAPAIIATASDRWLRRA